MFPTPPTLHRTTGFDPRTSRHFEGLFTQGSGYLHLRAALEEPVATAPQTADPLRRPGNVTGEAFPELPSRWGTYIPGVFADHPLLGHEMVNLPCFHLLTLEVAGETLDVTRSTLLHHERTFDLGDGLLRRTLHWQTRHGALIQATFLRFVSAARPHLCFQRLELSSDLPVELTATSLIDADVRTNGFDHFTRRACLVADHHHVHLEVDTNGGDTIEILSHFHHHNPSATPLEEAHRAGLAATLSLTATPTLLEKRTALATSRDLTEKTAREWLTDALPLSFDGALAEHRVIWASRWHHTAIELTGDPTSRLALRTSLHHLLRCQVTGDDRVAIDAKGFAGEAYYGRFFWDTEIFLLPFFLYTDPARARELVSFRLRTLPGARDNALRENRAGARYPWESSTTGLEQCPAWPYNEQELHVTADVVYGLAHYARAADPSFLTGAAAEAIVETARYWLDRIDELPDGRLRLSGVLGPDEYTPSCTDNAFTNRMVRFALATAAELGEVGGATPPERERFLDYSRRLPIPRSEPGDCILQCEGFDELPLPDFTTLWPDRTRPLAAQVDETELYPLKVLKQADVLALATLFPDDFPGDSLRRAWNHYLPFTTHDSSLSASVHALVAARLADDEAAWRFWLDSRDLDLDLSRGGAAEGLHIAGAAGTWMGVVFGFAGLKSAMWTEALTLAPRLPATWGSLRFPLRWRGVPVRVAIDRSSTTLTNDGAEPLAIDVAGERRTLHPGTTETFSMPSTESRPLAAILFDLDGVLISTDHLHFQGWTELTRREKLPFDWALNDQLRGVSRRRSLEIILEAAGRSYPEPQLEEMLAFKNDLYRASLETLSAADILPGALDLLDALRAADLPIAVVSSSRNAGDILRQTRLIERVDLCVDGNDTKHGKPDPEGFLLGASRLGVEPQHCVVIEDAPAGVEAGRHAGCAVVALGDRRLHPDVPHLVPSLEALTLDDLRAIVASPAQRDFQTRP